MDISLPTQPETFMKNLLIGIVASLATCFGAFLIVNAFGQPLFTGIIYGFVGFVLFVAGQWVALYFFLRYRSPPPTDSKGV